jgi:ferredoxin
MIRISFLNSDGELASELMAKAGDRLLEVAQNDGQPLEGTCEGQMACSTCHVIIAADWFAKLPKATEEEEDMLDLAPCATRYSRLACQIELTDALDGLTVKLPGEARNMQGR